MFLFFKLDFNEIELCVKLNILKIELYLNETQHIVQFHLIFLKKYK